MARAQLFHHIRQRGFTLMETVLVIAVGLGLLIGGIIFYQQAVLKHEILERQRVMFVLSTEIRALFSEKNEDWPSYSNVSEDAVRAVTSLPDKALHNLMLQGAGDEFYIIADHVPAKICALMAADPSLLGHKVVSAVCQENTELFRVTYAR